MSLDYPLSVEQRAVYPSLPEDVAALVLFFAWNDARPVAGHEYRLDAGWR